ncbi:hypothetical protein QQ008_14625 [Fulvivirgaceae bacterium BMA10]|uniref:Uncharacterized protein n=1 Tax=Splendidivirga corallicola TaxID=3051826 RepID=A0ABT8KT10_9BACT|nr:hypothetical protein [Fulvivirgaceae bacterium BMA10]
MLRKINQSYIVLHFFVVIIVCSIVLITSQTQEATPALLITTQENGLFEWGSFFIFLAISAFTLMILFHDKGSNIFTKFQKRFITLVAIGTYFLAMEEISWGQHILGFKTPGFFEANNLQKETNIHNLISGEISNLVFHSIVYIFFILIPIIVYIKPNISDRLPRLKKGISTYLPSLHNILMFCFASSLQAYFLPKTIVDTVVLSISLLILSILILSKKAFRTKSILIHLALVIGSTIIFMFNHHVFAYYNMQYEIREFVIGYAFLYWFYNWTAHVKYKMALQLR